MVLDTFKAIKSSQRGRSIVSILKTQGPAECSAMLSPLHLVTHQTGLESWIAEDPRRSAVEVNLKIDH